MEDNKTKNEKWKKVLLTIALVLQVLQVIATILAIVYQKDILLGIGNKNNNEFIIPFKAISTTILSLVIFCICYFLLIKKDRDNNSMTKEIITIILSIPVYYLSNIILKIFINKTYADNYANRVFSELRYGLILALEKYTSLIQSVFIFSSLIILAIAAAISIGKRKSKSDRWVSNCIKIEK